MFCQRLPSFATSLPLIYLLSTYLITIAEAETLVETFTDDQCKNSQQYFSAVDGYPDGACMNIKTSSSSSYGSFMITSLDNQCSITVYGNDTSDLTCSATILQLAEQTTCYNSSWIYISIDNCANGTASTTSSTASSSSKHASVGGIVGGVVGGIAFLAAIVGGTWYILLRRRRQRHRHSEDEKREEERTRQDDPGGSEAGVWSQSQSHQVDDNCVHELQPDSVRHEMEVKDSVSEAPAELRKVELEAAIVPVELEGHFS